MDLVVLKESLKKRVKNYYSELVFFKEYNLYDQLNAGISGGDSEMNAFIVSKKADISSIESDIDSLDSLEIIENFNVDFTESERRDFIGSNFQSCTTNEMRDMVSLALEDVKRLAG